MIRLFFFIMLVLCLYTAVLSQEGESVSPAGFYAGTIFNTEGAGLEAEYFYSSAGIRCAVMYINGLGLDNGEYIISVVMALTYTFNRGNFIQPVLFAGPAYSFQRWVAQNRENSGSFNDLTAGGGGGVVLKLIDEIMIGINLWINYDYEIVSHEGYKQKGDRFFLFFPFIDIRVHF